MLDFEQFNSGDFSKIFDSVREEKKDEFELKQTKAFLEFLENLEVSKNNNIENKNATKEIQIEHLKISENGDIIHDSNTKKIEKKVHGIEDLPKDKDFDFIFQQEEEDEPSIVSSSGRRLKDGKTVHSAYLNGLEEFTVSWTGISLDSFILIIGFITLILYLFFKFRKKQNQNRKNNLMRHEYRNTIREEVQREMYIHFQNLNRVNNFQVVN